MNKDLLKKSISNILIAEDPLNIYFSDDGNIDEYDFESGIIIRLLPDITNESDLLEKIYQVFKTSFGEIDVGSRNKYTNIANKIWKLIEKDRHN